MVKRAIDRTECPHIFLADKHARGKWTGLCVLPSLTHRKGIHIDALHQSLRGTLGSHQGNKSGARADVKHVARLSQICPGSKQDTVCAHRH